MARAAVKAKQQAKVQAARPARARGRRRHSGGGNPNQQLFFVRLRRGQKWLYALLAIVFALTFAGVGVGSGANGGLSQLWTGLFGGSGGSSVSKAQAEIKKDPAKGYRDLATAYETNGDNVQAMNALQSYLALNKNDASAWSELAGLELQQGGTYAKQYQDAQTAAQSADPSVPFQPGGSLAAAVGPNAAYQSASQTASNEASLLGQQATSSFQASVTDYKNAARLRPRSVTTLQELGTAAVNAGNIPAAVQAFKKILRIDPHTPLRPQLESELKQLEQSQPATGKK